MVNRMNDIGHFAEFEGPPGAKHASGGRISSDYCSAAPGLSKRILRSDSRARRDRARWLLPNTTARRRYGN